MVSDLANVSERGVYAVPETVWSVPLTGIVLGLLAGLVIGLWRRAHRREESLKALAALYRWTFTPESRAMTRRWRGQPFNASPSGRATDVLTGSHRGRHFAAFTFSQSDDAGNLPDQTTFAVFVLTLGKHLPAIEFTPVGWPAPPREQGGALVSFPPGPFRESWRVTAGNQLLARQIVHSGFARWLLRPDRITVPMRFEGSDVLAWHHGPLDVSRVAAELDALIEVIDLVPEQYRGAANQPRRITVTRRPVETKVRSPLLSLPPARRPISSLPVRAAVPINAASAQMHRPRPTVPDLATTAIPIVRAPLAAKRSTNQPMLTRPVTPPISKPVPPPQPTVGRGPQAPAWRPPARPVWQRHN
ncbi:MAG: hypothetical protein LBG70_04605 [Bifidobacteriaceae bacterium]|jgi:hypothetical protein|nr:hypothetical protein [Bifidobacteriaceae bacterium]